MSPKVSSSQAPLPPESRRLPIASAYREAPPTPDLMGRGRGRFGCGMIQSTANEKPKPPTPTVSLFEKTKAQRYQKFRSRSRSRSKSRSRSQTRQSESPLNVQPQSGPPKMEPRGAYPDGRVSSISPTMRGQPVGKKDFLSRLNIMSAYKASNNAERNAKGATGRTASSPRNIQSQPTEEASNTRAALLRNRKRVYTDSPRPRIISPEVGTSNKPILVGTSNKPILVVDVNATPTSKPPALSYASSSVRGVTPPPKPHTEILLKSSSSTGSSAARRDPIEESRGLVEEAREPISERRTTPGLDRIESTRGSPTDSSLQMRSSLAMPSLHSFDTSSRHSQEGGDAKTAELYRATVEKAQQLKNNRNKLTKAFESLHVEKPSKRESKPVQIYRIDSPSAAAPSLDQRTVRLLYSADFSKMIKDHQIHQIENILSQQQNENKPPSRHGVSFVVRKRALSKAEQARGEFDVVNAETSNNNALIVYQTKMLADLKTKDVLAVPFRFDSVFSELRAAEEFYIRVGQPGVLKAKDGGFATFVIYGSPGSGKTYTMTDIEERAAYDFFENMGSEEQSTTVSVQYVEFCDNQCFDLIGPIGAFVRVAEKGDDGSFRFKGALSKTASNPHELLQILSNAKRRLAKQATIRKRGDGNTFVLCQMTVVQRGRRGCLTLLECPADELKMQRPDSKGDVSESSSFDILMESIRARTSGRVRNNPYRASNNLTKIMQESLESPDSRICLLATISPIATSTESTLSTLSSLTKVMSGYSEQPEVCKTPSPTNSATSEEELVLPRQWDHSQLVEWMRKKNLLATPVPPDVNGRFAMRMSKMQLKNTFYDVFDKDKAGKLFMALRAENDRVARLRVKLRLARERQAAVE
jgi:hypothetical protein